MIPFTNRFHGHGSLRFVYKNGLSVRNRILTLKYTKNPHRKKSRAAVVVSKKVYKGAVGRNRIRRRIYEIIRQELDNFPNIVDVVFIVTSSEVMTMPADELRKLIISMMQDAGIYK